MKNDLQSVVSAVESGDNQNAIRFESSLFATRPLWVSNQIKRIQSIHKCSTDTAKMVACSSWGFYQILGANIYAQGYDAPVQVYCQNAADQASVFKGFITPRHFSPDEDVSQWTADRGYAFSTFYNGPGAPLVYWGRIKDVIAA